MSSFFVFDTNNLISAALRQKSTNRAALDKAIDLGSLAFSNGTFDELIEVLFRKKLDKYFANNNERWLILNKIKINSSLFFPDISLKASRDPKDDKFLELAISANA
ncbi:MAG TPA: putative toxin-antitoxin system toxin component, PIN family, partial [Chitinophagaceae bacterium]